MATGVNLRGDMKAIIKDLGVIEKRIQPKAASQSLNRVATKIRTQGIRRIASETGVAQKFIRRIYDNMGNVRKKNRITISGATVSRLSAWIFFRTRSIPAILLDAKQNKKGVKTKAKTYPGAFINNAMGGGKQVFKRKGKSRYPIEAKKIPIEKRGRVIFFELTKKSGPIFRKEFDRNMKRLLAKVRA